MEFLYKAVFLVPSIVMVLVGCLANGLSSAGNLLANVTNDYFEFIYGVPDDDDS